MTQAVITTKKKKFINMELTSNRKLISINENKF